MYLQARVLPISGVTFGLTVLQDANASITAMYTDGSSTRVQTRNQTLLYTDSPYIPVSTTPRGSLRLIRYQALFHDFVTIQLKGGTAQVVAEIDWSLNMAPHKIAEVKRQLLSEMGIYGGKMPMIDSLLVHLAPSPEAFALNDEARKLCALIVKRITTDGQTPFRMITEEERSQFAKLVDDVRAKLEKLPTLTSSEMQKEYEQVPETKLDRYYFHL